MSELEEVARRVRAARGYAGLQQHELGPKIGLERQSIWRMENEKREVSAGEKIAIAHVCGLPPDFFDLDRAFELPLPADPKRLERLGDQVAEILAGVQALVRAGEALGVPTLAETPATPSLQTQSSERNGEEHPLLEGARRFRDRVERQRGAQEEPDADQSASGDGGSKS